jgi:ribosomal protein L11 methyltransferase
LIHLLPDLLRVMKPSAQLFVTGILVEREPLFFEKFIEAGKLKVVRRLEKDEWVGFWLIADQQTEKAI